MNVLRSVTFIVGLLLAVAAFVAYLALGGVLNPPPYEVVVAVRDIPPYTIITSDALARDPQTMSGTVARTLVHAKELNRYVGGMAIEHIHAGEPLRKSAVIAAGNPAAARRLSLALDDPARVAMVMPVSPETCPEQIASGDYVNVLVSFAPGAIGGTGGQTLAEMLATPRPPLAVGPLLPTGTPVVPVSPTVSPPTSALTPTVSALSAEEMTLPIAKVTIQKCRVLAVRRRRVANPGFGISGAQGGQAFLEGDVEALVVLVPRDTAELLTFAIDNGKVHVVLLPAVAGTREGHDPTLGVAWSDVLAFILEERRKAGGEILEVRVPPTATPTPEGWLPPFETPTRVPPTAPPAPTPTKTAAVPVSSLGGIGRQLTCLLIPVLLGVVFLFFVVRMVKKRKGQ